MIAQCILTWSLTFGVDPAIVTAIGRHESGLNPTAVGALGEVGVLQVRPEYAPEGTEWLKKPCNGIKKGIEMLRQSMLHCPHQEDLTWVICHNLGQAGAAKIRYPKLHRYYKAVMKHYRSNRESLETE